MSRNPMLDIMQGYAFVDNISRANRQEQRAEEDRGRRIAMEDKLMAREDQAYQEKQELRGLNVQEIETIFGKDVAQNPKALKKVQGFWEDPERVGHGIAAYEEIADSMDNGKLPQASLVAEYANLAGWEELGARGGDDGLGRRVKAVYPGPSGKGVIFEFGVMDGAGKEYAAPMTKGAKRSEEDDEVTEVPLEKLMGWGAGAAETMRAIAMAKAKLGDNSFLEAYRAAKEARRKTAADAQGKLFEHELDKKRDSHKAELEETAAEKKYGRDVKLEKEKARLGRNDKLPAAAQLAEYLVSSGIAKDRKDAWRMTQQAKSDPVELAAKIAKDMEKVQADSFVRPGDEGYKSSEEIADDAVRLVKAMQQRFAETEPPQVGVGLKSAHSSTGPIPANTRKTTGGRRPLSAFQR